MTAVAFQGVTKRFGADTVAVSDLTLTVEEGEFLILVGPSGCGKTTALRMVAGLEEVSSGEISIGGRVVNDVPPAQRDIAMVFQSYALYPHMTVEQNIGFPLARQRLKRQEIADRVQEVARLLGLTDLLGRRPAQLSGGQRQRVAIGRALVRRPRAFLMDEPLSNLDAKLRVQMRAELAALHKRFGITTIYVTHDQTEAMTLGDRVVVMSDGVVQQVDTPERVYRYPRNRFVAEFIGSPSMNLLRGTFSAGTVRLGPYALELPPAMSALSAGGAREVIVGLRPEDLELAGGDRGEPGIEGTVEIAELLGPELIVHVRVDGLQVERQDDPGVDEVRGTIVARLDPRAAVTVGDRVGLVLNPERARFFDVVTGESLAPR